jgi:hypothetical protein
LISIRLPNYGFFFFHFKFLNKKSLSTLGGQTCCGASDWLVKDEWWFFTFNFMKTKLKNQLIVHLELVIWLFSRSSSPYKTSLLEQQFIIGRKTKLDMMLKLAGECECYSCPLFPWSMLFWIWWYLKFQSSSKPLLALKETWMTLVLALRI